MLIEIAQKKPLSLGHTVIAFENEQGAQMP